MFSEELSWPCPWSPQGRGEAANAGFQCQVAAPSPPRAEFAVYFAAFCHAPSWQQCANHSSPFSSTWCSPETCLFCWETPFNIAAVGFWLFFFCPDDSHISCWQLIGLPLGNRSLKAKRWCLFFCLSRGKKFLIHLKHLISLWNILRECFWFSFGARKDIWGEKLILYPHLHTDLCHHTISNNLCFVGFQGHVKINCFFHDEKAIWVVQWHQKNILTSKCHTYALEINKEWRFYYQSFHSFPLTHEPAFSCCESKVAEEESTHLLSPSQHSITEWPYRSHYLKRASFTLSRKKSRILFHAFKTFYKSFDWPKNPPRGLVTNTGNHSLQISNLTTWP